jgi:hypothetical protein
MIDPEGLGDLEQQIRELRHLIDPLTQRAAWVNRVGHAAIVATVKELQRHRALLEKVLGVVGEGHSLAPELVSELARLDAALEQYHRQREMLEELL